MDDLMFGKNTPDRREMPVRFAWAELNYADRIEAGMILKEISANLAKGQRQRMSYRVSEYKVAKAIAATLTFRNWYAFAWIEDEDESAADFEKPTVVVHPDINPETLR